jgi:hypothetical protein
LGSDEKSDSKIFADMLQEEFDKQEEDKKDLTLAIRETTKKVNGTYSVLIIEKATQRVFYFKERITSMYKIENNDWLIMSTEEKNVKFAKFWFGMKTKVKEVEHLYIYDVLNNFKKIRKFEEKPYVYQETKCYPCGGYGRGSIYGYDDDYHYTGKVERSAYDEEWIKDDRLTGIEESVSNSNGRNYRDFCDY